MKAITLTQPWATLVAIGAKKIETRSWATAYRGPLAIHAAKGLGPVGGKSGLRELCSTEPFCSVLNAWAREYAKGYTDLKSMVKRPLMPFGAIVATCTLTAVYRIPATPQRFSRCAPDDHPLASYPVTLPPFQDDQERAFGDYTPRRYAWLLEDVKALDAPIECKGALGLWEWKESV
jgi:hypothetical protein